MIGLVLFAYVGLVPQKARQEGANKKFKERKIEEFKNDNSAQLRADYTKFVADGYPNTRAEDRQILTEEHYADLKANAAVENMELKYLEIRWTDARLIVIGTVLSAIVVLLQSLFPAC